MNYRQRMNRGKSRRGTRSSKGFLRPMKKVRGRVNRRNTAVKVHSVTDTDFVLSTSFATYKIPRSYSWQFKNASQKVLQNVVCFGSRNGYVSLPSVYVLFCLSFTSPAKRPTLSIQSKRWQHKSNGRCWALTHLHCMRGFRFSDCATIRAVQHMRFVNPNTLRTPCTMNSTSQKRLC